MLNPDPRNYSTEVTADSSSVTITYTSDEDNVTFSITEIVGEEESEELEEEVLEN
jgi:hypothetical protein